MATEAARAIEAILMVAEGPIEGGLLAQLLEMSPGRVDELCAELAAAYEADDRGFALVRVAGGYRFQSHPDLAPYVERFVLEGHPARLSSAALETLAIVAYKQPITRAEIEEIRGVDVDGVLASLLSRKLVKIVGRKDVIGRPLLYGTTRQFLEVFGLRDLAGLPALTEVAVAAPEAVGAGAAATDATWSGDDSGSEDDGDPTAEVAGGRGGLLATGGGDADPAGQGDAERPQRDGARHPRDGA